MKEWIWVVLSTALILKIILGLIQITWSLKFFTKRKNVIAKKAQSGKSLFLLLPLLREQTILKECFARFVSLIKTRKQVRLAFVTTEREIIENNGIREGTTLEILGRLMLNTEQDLHERIILINYPIFNRVVAEQLNYAIQILNDLTPKTNPYYLLIYNADSIVTDASFEVLLDAALSGEDAAQQSSLFLWNFDTLLKQNKYLIAAFALYQSVWTLQHEVPRLLASSRKYSWLPSWLRNASLVHSVSHGLLLRSDVIAQVNRFPVNRFGGEDLGLGLILKVAGYEIVPVPVLENTEIPDNTAVLLRQLAGWFLGTLGYFVFWKRVPREIRMNHFTRLLLVSSGGVLDSAKWLLKGPLILGYLLLGYYIEYLGLSLMLYLVYIYTVTFGTIWLWYKLPSSSFPKSSPTKLVITLGVYWLVPILRSLPAIIGLWWGIRNALGFPFLKPKTER